ncbi:MAG: sigma-70 family RNA polymerase sigma factor [Candidatus Poribacteria bacterium]|nr:sigma-70 family RNA polymerase sigma factor [Candidatus Poribacteria bacterium]
MEQNDAELIQRILQGDQDALDPLVRKYQKGVHALVWRKIGDFHIAQEITQDAFLNAYRKLRTLKNPNQFAGWLYVIAANLCRDWLRRKRLPMESLDTEDANNTSEVDKVSYSKYLAEKQETDADETRREIVKELLQKLPESERTVMTLHYLGEMTIKAISEFLGVSQNTVKSRLSRARNRLRKEEDVIQQHLGSFQLPEQLTENILREAARITPIAPPSSKPMLPWVISAASAVLIFIFAGVGTQYLSRFQKPYNLNATSEPTVQIIDAVFIYDSPAKPAIRNQPGSSVAPGKGLGAGQKPEESLVATLPIDTTDVSMPKPQWTQAKGPEGAAINRLFAAANGDLYARTDTDLYRLADDGSQWQLVNADLSTNRSWHITEHNNRLYAVSDTEILTSIDRGETWDVLATRPEGALVDLVMTDEVFYLGLADGIYRSADAGESWVAVNNENLIGKQIQAITAIENSVFIGTDDGLYRHNSGGWEQLLVGEVSKNIRALASAEHRIYAAVGAAVKNQSVSSTMSMSVRGADDHSLFLYRSTDLGDSWQALEDFMETMTADSVEAATSDTSGPVKVTIRMPSNSPETEGTTELKMVALQESLWVVDSADSYYSNDSGETWVTWKPDTSDVGVVSTVVPLDARTLYKSGSSGIYRTTDAGKTWHQFNTGLVKTTVLNLVFTHKGLYANTGRVLVTSYDGGESWAPVPGASTTLTSLAKFNDAIYARGRSGMSPQLFLLSAEDNEVIPVPGMPILTPQRDEEIKNALLEAVPDDEKKNAEEQTKLNLKDLDIEDYNEVIADSIEKFLRSLFGSFAVSGSTYYMECEGKLFRWKLGATEWVDTGLVDTGPSIDSFNSLAGYAVIHANLAVSGKTVYVGKRDGHLFQSFDEGETWNDVTADLPFPLASFKALAFAGSTIYVATDKGVAFSSDGTHWHSATDLGGTPIVIERFAVDGTRLYGTSEQRVYQLNESSGIWQQVAPEIPMPITSLTVDGNMLYVGTDGSGVLRFTLDKSE